MAVCPQLGYQGIHELIWDAVDKGESSLAAAFLIDELIN